MYRTNQIDAILTEDTDLIAHGNNNVLFKLDSDGECLCVSFDRIKEINEFKNFEYDDFLIFCILCVF